MEPLIYLDNAATSFPKPNEVVAAVQRWFTEVGVSADRGDGPATTEHLVQHIEHAVNVCGEDHVGIGSDNSTTPTVADDAYRAGLEAFAARRQELGIGAPREYELLFVPELNTPRRMEQIADALLDRGHPEARVEKIIGGNWERYFSDVWRA